MQDKYTTRRTEKFENLNNLSHVHPCRITLKNTLTDSVSARRTRPCNCELVIFCTIHAHLRGCNYYYKYVDGVKSRASFGMYHFSSFPHSSLARSHCLSLSVTRH